MSQVGFNVIVGLLLRGVLMLGAGWLAGKGLLPQGSIEEWVGATTLAALGLGWSYYSKFTAKQEQNVLVATAIKGPSSATIADVQAKVDAGLGATVVSGAAVKVLLPLLLLPMLWGCTPKPVNLTPEAGKAWTADQVVIRVNRLMDAAISAESQGLPRNTVRRIVTFCVEADQTLAAVPDGWGPTVLAAWTQAKADPDLKPYLANLYISAAVALVDAALQYYAPIPKWPEPVSAFLIPPTFSLEVV